MGWQDTERGHTGMAGVGTEVGGGKEGEVGGSVAVRGFMETSGGGFNKQEHSGREWGKKEQGRRNRKWDGLTDGSGE